jgi:hypothetical protein
VQRGRDLRDELLDHALAALDRLLVALETDGPHVGRVPGVGLLPDLDVGAGLHLQPPDRLSSPADDQPDVPHVTLD